MTTARLVQASLAVAALLTVQPTLHAQELRGTVRDAASRQPIPGAVITLLDSRGSALGRNITDQQGRYRIAMPSQAVTLRFVRIGFRPSTANIPRSGAAVDTLDVVDDVAPYDARPGERSRECLSLTLRCRTRARLARAGARGAAQQRRRAERRIPRRWSLSDSNA